MPVFKKILLALGVLGASTGYVFWARSQSSPQPTAESNPGNGTAITDTPTSVKTPVRSDDDDYTPITANPQPTPAPAPVARYIDGSYTGTTVTTVYGPVQVAVVIRGGKITEVTVPTFPNDRENSIRISNQALPILKQEALTAQSAQVSGVSGATETSQGFKDSLQSALTQAA
jgi:uncharacterized protein with FMN-binding domain